MRGTLVGTIIVVLALFVAGCDTGDGRDMREPAVPYVAPTDPPTTSTP